ncbi:MAG: 4Fe-4S binding protein, partial [Deltaproteobacteria bacterium]|nr:4Fe-4S binding protein [Deltaproteobacteria bacterium]
LFADHVKAILEAAMEDLSAQTGRALTSTTNHRLKGARRVIVTVGAATELAEEVTNHVAGKTGTRVGVLGLTTLRPFPTGAVAAALSSAESVVVLDRSPDALAGSPPLSREVRSALPPGERGFQTAIYPLGAAPLAAADLAALCTSTLAAETHSVVHLGLAPPAAHSRFPTREVHLQALERGYPGLAGAFVQADAPLDLAPSNAAVLSLWQRAAKPTEDWLSALARAASESDRPHIRAHTFIAEEGVHVGRVTAANQRFRNPGVGSSVHIALIDDVGATYADTPLRELRPGGTVLISTPLVGGELWAALPPSWRDLIRTKKLVVRTSDGNLGALVQAVPTLLAGDEPEELLTLDWASFDTKSAAAVTPSTPTALERFGKTRDAYDNVPHFYNAVLAPRLAGKGRGEADPSRPTVDPLLTAGTLPSYTAAFHDASPGRRHLPSIDPDRCTGCGQCWLECSDSAIASVAIGVGPLLDAAADLADLAREPGGVRDDVSAKLRRAHSKLAARIDVMVAKAGPGTTPKDVAPEAFAWLVDKMGISAEDKPEYQKAFDRTAKELARLPVSVTDVFWRAPHREKKGTGEYVMLAVDARSCQACGGCVTACAEEAVAMVPQTDEVVRQTEELHRLWSRLPDTSGGTIARASAADEVGPLPALLMSRHCAGALTGGDFAEAGSGERLALRLVAAAFEHRSERRLVAQLEQLTDQKGRVRGEIQAALAASLSSDDLSALDEALTAVPGRPKNLGALVSRLDELGVRNTVDRDRVQALVTVAKELEAQEDAVRSGADGLGRARFGIVLAGESVGQWAARFPRNPFAAPVAVDLMGNGPELAMGLLAGLNADCVEEARTCRRAELLLQKPSDLEPKLRELGDLGWRDLSPEEHAGRPPLLVVVGPEALSEQALPGLSKLLAGDQDIKVLLMDGRDRLAAASDPVMFALAHRRAFVLSTSIAHPRHLFDGLDAALLFQGPALIHIHTPSPSAHGFSPDRTVEHAHSAVTSRVQPLLRYDPSRPGVYGARLSLEGNAQPERVWATDEDGRPHTPARWALSEGRFASSFVAIAAGAQAPCAIETWVTLDRHERHRRTPTIENGEGKTVAISAGLAELSWERYENFRTLQELAGLVTPFTESVRKEVEAELAAGHRAELEAQKAEYEARLMQQESDQTDAMAARLKARLLELSGSVPARRRASDEVEGS